MGSSSPNRPGIEPGPPALGAWSLSHWTTREVPWWVILNTDQGRFDGKVMLKQNICWIHEWLNEAHKPCCVPCSLFFLSSVQSLSCVWLFVTPWNAARQASLSITNSRSLLKLMSIESVMPSTHLILYCLLLLLPSVFPSIRESNESVLCIRWPKYWSFSFSISPSN